MERDKLQNRDYTLIVDRSGSMNEHDGPSGMRRWDAAREATFALASKVAEFDPDGITLYVFGSSFKRYDNVTPDKVNDIWKEVEPMGSTALAEVLIDALTNYFSRKNDGKAKANGELIVVVTDGEPNNKGAVSKVINEATKIASSAEEIGISFIQVGKDVNAAQFLKQLDTDLVSQGAKYDIVDTKTAEECEGMSLTEVLIQALTD